MAIDANRVMDAKNAFIKASAYCVYRDRCIKEIALKLKEWNVSATDIPNVLQQLVNEGFINEERYALAFARGKFRINQWGKIKISGFLRMNGIDNSFINKALSEIDPGDYKKTLTRILETKTRQLKISDNRSRNNKLINFATSKGFEYEIIKEILDNELK